MLAYAFEVLRQDGYKKICTENFERAEDLLSTILDKLVGQLLKQGLYREYINKEDELKTLKGRLVIDETIKCRVRNSNSLVCNYDNLETNNLFNQIIKTTIWLLVKKTFIKEEIKKELKKKIIYFNDVDLISNVKTIRWNNIRYNQNNKIYQAIIGFCHLIIDGCLHTTEEGNKKLLSFIDERRIEKIYEHFILKYYKELMRDKMGISVSAPRIDWAYSNSDYAALPGWPAMKSDCIINDQNNCKTLIIDAKLYGSIMGESQYSDKLVHHSHNIYQLFTYVQNQARQNNQYNVAGLLLYAKTTEENVSTGITEICGNRLGIHILDLNQPFENIKLQLNNILINYF